MRNLKAKQLRILADYLNYVAVAWITAGWITPLLNKPDTFFQTIKMPVIGMIMSFIFLFSSLMVVREAKL